jgi:D-arabinose 1-dehydrogenase-like Zn-dependent alcohol dehydrogenase
MKEVGFSGECKVEIREFTDPAPGPGEVVQQINASGMCGTDLGQYLCREGRL